MRYPSSLFEIAVLLVHERKGGTFTTGAMTAVKTVSCGVLAAIRTITRGFVVLSLAGVVVHHGIGCDAFQTR